MLYLLHEAPPEEQNFPMVMEMIAAAEVHEDDDNYQSPLDILFERLEMRELDSIACKPVSYTHLWVMSTTVSVPAAAVPKKRDGSS